MAKGPQLTQCKIDKLRDALRVVVECDQVQRLPHSERLLTEALDACQNLKIVLPPRPGTFPNICGALAPVPANGYCNLLPSHEGAHDSGYMVYDAANRGYIQETVKE